MRSFAINLVVATIWMLLQATTSIVGFLVGWLVGFLLLALFRPILGSGDYVRRSLGLVRFVAIFTRAFLVGCWQLVVISMTRRVRTLQPRVITYDIRGLSLMELLLLSHSISLTPGTTTIDIPPQNDRLVLHVLDAPDPEAVRCEIDRTLRRGILAFTR